MTSSTCDSVFEWMRADRICLIHGCLLWLEHEPPSEVSVQADLERYGLVFVALGGACERSSKRARAAYESDVNRRFVATELECRAQVVWTPADLVRCAERWSARLRMVLARRFPELPVTVETIGLEGADDEPLELCITCYQSPDSP